MIFGRRNRSAKADDDLDDLTQDVEDGAPEPDEADDEEAEALAGPAFDRSEGPFDASEVDLGNEDAAKRLSLGPLSITRHEDIALNFQGNPETRTIYSVLAMHENSGLVIELFAAPSSGGMATEMAEDTIEEAEQAGGNAEVSDGPFGREVRRVLPMEGPEGEQLFHVSRLWFVDGPRWLLRGTLMGQASLAEGEAPPADVFVEFFRNVVVHRDETPRFPGELLTLTLPDDVHVAQG